VGAGAGAGPAAGGAGLVEEAGVSVVEAPPGDGETI
jgi:hypothetical protein